MASIKFRLDIRRVDKDGNFPLKLIIYHNQKNVAINVGMALREDQWNDDRQAITKKHPAHRKLNDDLSTIYGKYVQRIRELTDSGKIRILSASDIKDKLINEDSEYFSKATFNSYLDKFIETAKIKTDTYIYAKNTIAKFSKDRTLLFEEINYSWLSKFEDYLIGCGLAVNSRFTIFKTIRSIFNKAIDEEVIGQEVYPFRRFKLKTEATQKRSLSIAGLRLLMDYPCQEHQKRYRDMFMLIFYLVGINSIDLFNLKEIKDGRIEYRRAKTGRLYSIKVEPEALAIIERYKGKKYLLNILDTYSDHKNFVHRLNKNLQSIGEVSMVVNNAEDPTKAKKNKKSIAPLFPDLTTYWARHTWATIAASLDIPKETIAAALGHGGNTVTDIYIDFDQRKVDEANRKVLDYVLGLKH